MTTSFAAYDKLLEGVQVISPEMRYLYVNDAVCEHAKVPPDKLLGRKMEAVFPGIENTAVYRTIQSCWANRQPQEYVNEFDFPNGTKGYFLLRMQAIAEGVLIMSYDVSDAVNYEKQLHESNRLLKQKNIELTDLNEKLQLLSVTDELTGLFNRRHFIRCLREEFARFGRNQDRFCVALLDIDDFKKINDSQGHDVGDLVLRSFASVLKTHIRRYDLLARYGGEEFTLLMRGTTVQQAQQFVARLDESILKAVTLNKFGVTFSAGLAQPSETECDAHLLMKSADSALYAAKREGKHIIKVANE